VQFQQTRAITIHVHLVTGVVANAPKYAAQKYFGRSAASYSRAEIENYYGPRNIARRAFSADHLLNAQSSVPNNDVEALRTRIQPSRSPSRVSIRQLGKRQFASKYAAVARFCISRFSLLRIKMSNRSAFL
jgi:hypothetical protein